MNLKAIKTYIIAHKALSITVGLVAVASSYGVWSHAQAGVTTTTYVFGTVAKGTLVSSISGSGQVAAENQVNITSTVSGDINSVSVLAGDEVKAGQTLATIESSDAVRALNNAELSLENAQVAYDKAKKQAADQIASSSASDIAKAYQTGYNVIVATSIDLPAIFGGVSDIYYSASHSPYFSDVSIATQADSIAVTYKTEAGAAFDLARAEYNSNFLRFKNISTNSSPEEITSLLNETNIILKKLLGALSGTYGTMDYIQSKLATLPAQLTADKASISSYVSKVNADTTSVTNALTSIDDAKTSGTSANLDMKSAELAVNQASATLSDAQKALSDHRVKAPFDGIIAKVSAKLGDKAANGMTVATIVTAQQIVNISLNEIDAAKVSKGDKATLTFDAIEDLTLAGHVSNVDIVGTVSQGVVTYVAEVAFDDIDPRVKPGMTVSANIITKAKQDVLLVPSSAVKTSGGTKYVQVMEAGTTVPVNAAVTVGDSNDTSVEIVSGLTEGERIITKATAASAAKSATPSILNSIGGARAGGAVRATSAGANVQFISR